MHSQDTTLVSVPQGIFPLPLSFLRPPPYSYINVHSRDLMGYFRWTCHEGIVRFEIRRVPIEHSSGALLEATCARQPPSPPPLCPAPSALLFVSSRADKHTRCPGSLAGSLDPVLWIVRILSTRTHLFDLFLHLFRCLPTLISIYTVAVSSDLAWTVMFVV